MQTMEPAYETLLLKYTQSLLQTPMLMDQTKLDVSFELSFHLYFVKSRAKALVRLRRCEGLSEHLLPADAISIKSLCTGSYIILGKIIFSNI